MQKRNRAHYLRPLCKDGRDADAWGSARCGERGSLRGLGRECGGGVLGSRQPRCDDGRFLIAEGVDEGLAQNARVDRPHTPQHLLTSVVTPPRLSVRPSASSAIRTCLLGARRTAHRTSYHVSGGSPAFARACSMRPTTEACAFSNARQAERCGSGTRALTRASLRGIKMLLASRGRIVSMEITIGGEPKMSEFEGKVAVITGGGGGIGKAAAARLLDEGASVVLSGRRQEVLDAARQELDPSGDRVELAGGDVSSAAAAEQPVALALERFGRLDVLVNSTGIFRPVPFLEQTEAHVEEALDSILRPTFYTSQAAARAMVDRGEGGAIVNVGSMWAIDAITATPTSAYSAAQAGRHS